MRRSEPAARQAAPGASWAQRRRALARLADTTADARTSLGLILRVCLGLAILLGHALPKLCEMLAGEGHFPELGIVGVHLADPFPVVEAGFAYLVGLAAFVVAGAGRYSVDGAWSARARRSAAPARSA